MNFIKIQDWFVIIVVTLKLLLGNFFTKFLKRVNKNSKLFNKIANNLLKFSRNIIKF